MFDKDVLTVKQLVKDIGDLNTLIHKKQKKNILYDKSKIISSTFFTQLNKNIQSYGTIWLQYNYNKENLTNLKINHNIKKEFITLQLEDILTPKKIETGDLKVTNMAILSVAESKIQIKDEFIIEGFQNFEQYIEINPIIIRITDPNLQTKLLFYSRKYKYKYKYYINIYYLVRQLKKIQMLLLLLLMG